jgi:diguanylate cyclase (GGDEF)-like protein
MFKFFQQSIARKIALMVGLSCLLVMLVGLVLMMFLFRSDIQDHTRQSLEILSNSLRAGFSAFDQERSSHPIAEMISDLSARKEIINIRVFNKSGKITWSQAADEPGTELPADVYAQFRSGRSELHPDTADKTIGTLQFIRADSSCLACHSSLSNGDLLGGIHMEASYAKLTEKLTGYGHLRIVTSLLLVAFVTVMTVLMVKIFLSQPLRRLTRAIEAAEDGNYLSRVELQSPDEMGRLAENFNNLLVKLTEIEASKIDTDMELDIAQHELRFKKELEEKKQIIEETNRKLTRRLSDLALLYDVSQALASTLDTNQILKVITEKIGVGMGFEGFSILLTDQQQKQLRICSTLDRYAPKLIGQMVDPLQGHFAKAVRKRDLLLLPDLSKLSRLGDDLEYLPGSGSFLSIPLQYKDRVLGLLNFIRKDKNDFSVDAVQLLTSVAQQVAMALLNSHLFQEKLDLSVTDELTQLANRRLFQTRLELEWNRARRFNSPLSLLMVDIDHFKVYNDRNGHLLGDKALKELARILEKNTRKVDTVARFGGEEFVIILPGQDRSTAKSVADKLRRAVFNGKFTRTQSQPGGHLTISVGVATYPGDAEDSTVLLNRSDLALYASKRAGRDRTIAFEDNMQKMEKEHLIEMQAKKTRRRRRKRRSKPRMDLVDPT